MPSLPKTSRRCARPFGESQSPSPPWAARATSRSGRASAISVAASRPVRPPPTTTTACTGVQPGQALAQPQRSGAARDLVGVLGGARDAAVVPAAAEGVDEGVVGQFRSRPSASPTATVLRSTSTAVTFASFSSTPVPANISAKRPGPEVLADRELVHPDALDEVGLGVDEGDGDVLAAQPLGEPAGRDGSGCSRLPRTMMRCCMSLLLSARVRRFWAGFAP